MSDNYQQLVQEFSPALIRRHTREQMGRTRPSFWMVTLVSMVLTSLIPDAVTGLFPTTTARGQISVAGLFLYILMNLFIWLISFGYDWWALDCADDVRGESAPGVHTLFNGFSMVSGVLLLEIGIAVRTLLWSMVLSVPTALLIMFLTLAVHSTAGVLGIAVAAGIAVWLLVYWVGLRYCLARYLYMDQPEACRSTARAIRDSVELMRGWKWKAFRLHLSFFGWRLLAVLLVVLSAVLTALVGFVDVSLVLSQLRAGNIMLAIGTLQAAPAVSLAAVILPLPLDLWLTPYTTIANARFYRLRTQVAQCPPPMQERPEDRWNDFEA